MGFTRPGTALAYSPPAYRTGTALTGTITAGYLNPVHIIKIRYTDRCQHGTGNGHGSRKHGHFLMLCRCRSCFPGIVLVGRFSPGGTYFAVDGIVKRLTISRLTIFSPYARPTLSGLDVPSLYPTILVGIAMSPFIPEYFCRVYASGLNPV
jgi:hypothetical protein